MIKNLLKISKNGINYDFDQNKKIFFFTDKKNKISENIKEIIIKEEKIIIVINNVFDDKTIFGEDIDQNMFFTFEVYHSEQDKLFLEIKDLEQNKWTRISERKPSSKKAFVSFEKTFLDEDNVIVVNLLDLSESGCSFVIPIMYFSQIEKIRTIKIDNKEKDIIVRNNTFDKDCLILGVEFIKS